MHSVQRFAKVHAHTDEPSHLVDVDHHVLQVTCYLLLLPVTTTALRLSVVHDMTVMQTSCGA